MNKKSTSSYCGFSRKWSHRIPLEAFFDLTYRCNNDCRHCWLRLPGNAREISRELTYDEIRRIADEARILGTQSWAISGGEPMVRPDFSEIFEYLTRKAITYSLNTNGTLITPAIARQLKRKGSKMIALYGACAKTHDHITRTPGSFESVMRGMAYLKEANAGFTVQVIPLRDSWHEYKQMLQLAESLSPDYRIGASWLYLSAYNSSEKNMEILGQRLPPRLAISIDPPDVVYEEKFEIFLSETSQQVKSSEKKGLFSDCISSRNAFHVNPYGGMSICSRVIDPSLRYDLRKGNIADAWTKFIPAIPKLVSNNLDEYKKNCGSCAKRKHCRWCAAYSYLESGRYAAPISHLCQMADEAIKQKNDWIKNHRRFFSIAGASVQLDSDLPISKKTFNKKFNVFRIDNPGAELVRIRLHFAIPKIKREEMGVKIYDKSPWIIYRKSDNWVYVGLFPGRDETSPHSISIFNRDHSQAEIFYDGDHIYKKGNNDSLSLFPTDQIYLGHFFAERGGAFIHSSGMKINGKGLLFAGHSEAGKSTMVTLLRDEGEILCDERIIIRRWPDGFKIHGTWSHGDVPHVSAGEAPLGAVLFLEKSKTNRLIRIEDPKEILKRLIPLLIRPLITADWWDKTLVVVERLLREVPAYRMQFNKSGKIAEIIRELVAGHGVKSKPPRTSRLP
jgi:radical SAM protein with 4Fe4S-binding SPASM domain